MKTIFFSLAISSLLVLLVIGCKKEDIKVSFETYIAYNFDVAQSGIIEDLSTDAIRGGIPEGTLKLINGPQGRGMAADFNGQWRLVSNQSTSNDFSMTGNWTMGFSIYLNNNCDFGNGLIQRTSSNSGYCGFRGFYMLQSNDFTHGIVCFDENFIPDTGFETNSTAALTGLRYNQWNRVIIIHRSSQLSDIYINGELVSSNVNLSIAETGTKKLSIGGNYFNDYCYGEAKADGIYLDDFVIIKKAITADEVSIDSLEKPIGIQ